MGLNNTELSSAMQSGTTYYNIMYCPVTSGLGVAAGNNPQYTPSIQPLGRFSYAKNWHFWTSKEDGNFTGIPETYVKKMSELTGKREPVFVPNRKVSGVFFDRTVISTHPNAPSYEYKDGGTIGAFLDGSVFSISFAQAASIDGLVKDKQDLK